jgi:hypothetical protein
MSAWMKNLKWGRVFKAGFAYLVIATVLQQIEVMFTMSYYKDPAYFGLWSKLMMPTQGPPPLAFFAISLLFTFATGCTLAAVFEFMSPLFGKQFWGKVIGFTDIMVGLTIVFSLFPIYLLLNVPLGLLGWWLVTSWVTTLVSAMAFAKLTK